MRRYLLTACAVLALAGSPALSGCNTLGAIAGPAPGAQATVDEKAMIVAESAYAGILAATEKAVDAGVLKGANAAKARDLLHKADAARKLAERAYDAGNAASGAAALAQLAALVGEISALIQGAKS